jgi:hypothetical protein
LSTGAFYQSQLDACVLAMPACPAQPPPAVIYTQTRWWCSRNLCKARKYATKRGHKPLDHLCLHLLQHMHANERSTNQSHRSGLDQLEQDRDQKVSPLDSNPIHHQGDQSINQPYAINSRRHLCASSPAAYDITFCDPSVLRDS